MERLPSLPPTGELQCSGAEVQADAAAMGESPEAGRPFWLTAWAETAPLAEYDGVRAPSAIYFRKMNEAGDSLTSSPRILLTRSESASKVEVERGINGAWVVAHSVTDGLRAWWIPADTSAPPSSPVAIYSGVESLRFKCASDGTNLWVWLATPARNGPDWQAAGQERLAVLELRSGAPALKRIAGENRLPNHSTEFSMFARGGRLIMGLSRYIHGFFHFDGTRFVLIEPGYTLNEATFWSTNAGVSGTVQSKGGAAWLGIVPWSGEEILAITAEPLLPTSTIRVAGQRFTAAGMVPGAADLTLTYTAHAGPPLPLQEGGIVPVDSGYAIVSPGFSGTVPESEAAIPWRAAAGNPAAFLTLAADRGTIISQVRRNQVPGPQLPLTEGRGRISSLRAGLGPDSSEIHVPGGGWQDGVRVPGVTGWSSEHIRHIPALPVITWQAEGAELGGNIRGYSGAAMYQRNAGWGFLRLPLSAQISGTASMPPQLPQGTLREILACSGQNGDIFLHSWNSSENSSVGAELFAGQRLVASGPAPQAQAVAVRESGRTAAAWYVESQTDSSGDTLTKLRKAQISSGGAATPVTHYVSLRTISRLSGDGTGSLVWTEGEFIFTADTSPGTGSVAAFPAFSQGAPLQAYRLLAGSGPVLALQSDSGPVAYARVNGEYQAAGPLLPVPAEDSVTAAGNSVFWIGREPGGASYRLFLQSFSGGAAGPVQEIPTGPLVPGELAAAAGSNGRLLVTVLELDGHLPAPAGYMLAQNPEGLPALQIRQRGPGWADLLWNPTALFPSDRVRLESSTNLRQWQPVSETSMIRTPASGWQLGIPGGFQWTATHPATDLQVFFRLRADLVP